MPIERMLRTICCRRLLEGEVQAALAAAAGGVEQSAPPELVLPVPAVPEISTRAAAVVALAAEHGVEPGDARRDALVGRLVLQAQRGDRQHRDAVLVDQERILVGAVSACRGT